MKSSKELKKYARENLTGKYRIAIGAYLFSFIIPFIIEFPFSGLLSGPSPTITQYVIYYTADVLISVLAGVITIGNSYVHLKIARDQQVASYHVFFGFKNQTDRYIIGFFIYFLFNIFSLASSLYAISLYRTDSSNGELLTALFFAILSLILRLAVALVYGLVFYVLIDFQEYTVVQCFTKARELMRGNRGRYFYITLSFIGLELLAVLSLGVGLLWIEPYKQQTFTNFYRELIGEFSDEYVSDQTVE